MIDGRWWLIVTELGHGNRFRTKSIQKRNVSYTMSPITEMVISSSPHISLDGRCENLKIRRMVMIPWGLGHTTRCSRVRVTEVGPLKHSHASAHVMSHRESLWVMIVMVIVEYHQPIGSLLKNVEDVSCSDTNPCESCGWPCPTLWDFIMARTAALFGCYFSGQNLWHLHSWIYDYDLNLLGCLIAHVHESNVQ